MVGQHTWVFFAVTFAWSWSLNLPRVLHSMGDLGLPETVSRTFGALSVFGPFVAAVGLTYWDGGIPGVVSLLRRGWDFAFAKAWLVPTLFLMPAIGGITLAVLTLFKQPIPWEVGLPLPMVAPVFLLILLLNGLPEEYGWRGYALERLQQQWSPLAASLLLGLGWGVWHIPLHFISGTVQAAIPVTEYIAQTMVLAVLYTWLYNHTGGRIAVAALFHAAANVTGAAIPYWTTEVGRWVGFVILLIATLAIVAVWRPRRIAHTPSNRLGG